MNVLRLEDQGVTLNDDLMKKNDNDFTDCSFCRQSFHLSFVRQHTQLTTVEKSYV